MTVAVKQSKRQSPSCLLRVCAASRVFWEGRIPKVWGDIFVFHGFICMKWELIRLLGKFPYLPYLVNNQIVVFHLCLCQSQPFVFNQRRDLLEMMLTRSYQGDKILVIKPAGDNKYFREPNLAKLTLYLIFSTLALQLVFSFYWKPCWLLFFVSVKWSDVSNNNLVSNIS